MSRTKGSANKRDGATYVPPMDVPHYAERVAFERRADAILGRRSLIEGLMRHEPSNDSRGSVTRAASSVNATTVNASPRQRVADSHDARDAGSRSSVRPYSARQLALDIERQYPNGARSGDAFTFTVPTWFVTALDGLDGETRTVALAPFTRRTFSKPSDERTERTERESHKPVSVTETRAARQRSIAGTIRMAEQD